MRLRCLVFPFFCLFLLFGFQNYASAQNQNSYPLFAAGINWSFGYHGVGKVAGLVENVPADLRTLPSHEDDVWIYGETQVLRTIPSSSIEPNPIYGFLALYVGPEVTIYRLNIRTGINFSLPLADSGHGRTKSNEGATREANQAGNPSRGYGASLVYYNMYIAPTFMPGWFGEASLNLFKSLNLVGGWEFYNFRLRIESGYDRYDRLETYDKYTAAAVRLWRTYGGIEVGMPIEPTHRATALQILVGRAPRPFLTAHDMTISQDGRWSVTARVLFRYKLTG